jgi:hypothetical protein
MLELESHLVAEIEFWRELIEGQNTACAEATLERMRQALALAERKLRLLSAHGQATTEPGHGSRTEH